MRKLLLSSVAIFVLVVPTLSSATEPPRPAVLWHEIQALQKSHSLMLESKPYQLGSRSVDVYTIDLANSAENDAIRKAGGITKVKRYPNGALVVKENFDANRKLTGVTAMLKLDGYDKTDRDWVMAAYKPNGQVVAYGKVQACISCHVMVTRQDLVFAPPPQQLLPVSVWKAFFPKQEISSQYAQLLKQYPEAIVK